MKSGKWLRLILVLLCWTGSDRVRALGESGREANFAEFHEKTLLPWFAKGEVTMIAGTPRLDGSEMKLRTIRFRQAKPIAHIIIVHGFSEMYEKYQEMAYDFYQEGYSVYLYDQRGFGKSGRLADELSKFDVESFAHYTKDLGLILETIDRDDEPVFLFAHSMGAAVSTVFAGQNPDLVSGLIVSAPMYRVPSKPLSNGLVQKIAALASQLGLAKAYAPGQAPVDPSYWNFERAATSSLARWTAWDRQLKSPELAPIAAGGACFHWMAEVIQGILPITTDAFARQFSVPVLLFQAGQDTWVDPEGQTEFCQKTLRCEKVIFPEAKHEIFMEIDAVRVPYMERIKAFTKKLSQKADSK